jgi:hypothetical protein
MGKLAKFVRLPAGERRLLVESALLVAAVRLGLWLLPFRTLRRLLDRAFDQPSGRLVAAAPDTGRIAWAVAVVSEHIPHATCLTQALATRALLRRRGQPAELRIGVVRSGHGYITAHAWVESQGRIVIGGTPTSVARYEQFPSLESK